MKKRTLILIISVILFLLGCTDSGSVPSGRTIDEPFVIQSSIPTDNAGQVNLLLPIQITFNKSINES